MLTLKACLSMLACVFTCKYKACSTVKACYLVVTTNIPVNSVDRRLERRITVSWGMMSHFWVIDTQWPEGTCRLHPQGLNTHGPSTLDSAGTRFLWNAGKHLPSDTASPPRKLKSLIIQLWIP